MPSSATDHSANDHSAASPSNDESSVTTASRSSLVEQLGLRFPIIQAPMAGVSTPALAAAVSNAGGLGSLGVAAMDTAAAQQAIVATRALTDKPFGVNLFCHLPARRDAACEAAWLQYLTPLFNHYDAEPPTALREIYQTYLVNDAMHAMLLAERPAVVTFHFGLPSDQKLRELQSAGIYLMASATNLQDALTIQAAGVDAVVAQGIEAGGHRGVFDVDAPDDELGLFALTRLLVAKLDVPVVSAGGIMDGAGIAAVLTLGAQAAQLGTAFVSCPESAADADYRAALLAPEVHTGFTKAISGRKARGVRNRLTEWGAAPGHAPIPDYPLTYDAGKALNAAAKAKGASDCAAQWAGQAAALSRALPAHELVQQLAAELAQANSR